jgi:TRAP-type C4-dicarboxylate transport system substrate-binding protein
MTLRRSLLAIATFGGLVTARAETVWDMPTAYPGTIFHTENIVKFADEVRQASGGQLKIVVHPNGTLFRANEIKRAVQGGQAQIGEVIISSLANEDPIFGVDSIPFLATSYEQARKLAVASQGEIAAKLARQGLKVLYTVPWTPQGLYTNVPIRNAADMKGLKMRAYNPATSRLAELVSAQAMTIQAAEFGQALATGVVNAYMTSAATGYDMKAWENSKYFYDMQAWIPLNMVFVNQKSFDALPAATRQVVLKAAQAAGERGWKISQEQAKSYVDQLVAHGMKVSAPSAALASDLKKVGDKMIDEWVIKAGPDGRRVLEEYRK